jgi:hypothetical protein
MKTVSRQLTGIRGAAEVEHGVELRLASGFSFALL